jgi:hypothetical protein
MAFLSIEPLREDLGKFALAGINWVIVGGERGAGARPMAAEWVISIQRQCAKAKIPFFLKQWGGVRKSTTGCELNGRTFDEMPDVTCNGTEFSLLIGENCSLPNSARRGRRHPEREVGVRHKEPMKTVQIKLRGEERRTLATSCFLGVP